MELPAPLRAAVDRMLEGVPLADLRRAAARLSTRYRAETRDGRMHLDEELAVKAYLAARLPATYAAVRSGMAMVEEAAPSLAPHSLLDVGAGPGTALWAAQDAWPSIRTARMLEASGPARTVGTTLSALLAGIDAAWIDGDAARDLDAEPAADLVTLAYVLDELPPDAIAPLIGRLWALTRQVLVVVEPGTPAGWRRTLAVRRLLVEAGAHIAAPCPHEAPCPLSEPDWCHFARRVARSRLHRLAKEADVPWEDEKYILVAAARMSVPVWGSRVLAPPGAGKAWLDLKLCRPEGDCAHVRIGKRDREAYRTARRLDWGDVFDVPPEQVPISS